MPPRLVTLTLNPALDIACSADVVQHTHKIRTGDDHLDPGGGGVNVARVLHELGGDTLAVIMTGGVTGALIEELLDKAEVPRLYRADPRSEPASVSQCSSARPAWNTASYRKVPASTGTTGTPCCMCWKKSSATG